MLRSFVVLLPLAAFLGSSAPDAEHVVRQADKTFSAEKLTAKVGDVVTFVNDDAVTHNVFSNTEGNKFNLKTQAPGSSSNVTLQAAGKVEVRCAFHPTMKLTIDITP